MWILLSAVEEGCEREHCGAQGVIFSVELNLVLRLLCSTSDDRSLRVYRFHEHVPSGYSDVLPNALSLDQLSRGWFTTVHVLYGHESRVWRGTILKDCYLSVGEVR